MRFVRVLAVAFVMVVGAGLVPNAAAADEVIVRIGDRLDPADLSVAAGTVVRWVNEDGDRHRLRSTGGPVEFDTGNLEPGESATTTFTSAGRTTYVDDRNRGDAAYHGAVTVGSAPGASSGGGTSAPGPAAAPAGTSSITIVDGGFSPASVVVAPGATIRWTNADDRDHTGTADSAAFDTGNLAAGASATTSHPAEGTFSFRCELHPDMTGVVRVASGSAEPAPVPPPPPTSSPTPAPASAPASAAAARTVNMGDLFFAPQALDVRVGDTVTWTNVGRAPHTATSASFDSGRVAPGATFRWTAASPGTIAYGCTIHPDMTGQLRVLAASAPAPAVVAPPPVQPLPTTTTTAITTTTSEAQADAPQAATVEVQDFAFAPGSVRLAVGGTVTWSFTGKAPHTATGDAFDSGMLEQGATFEHTFTAPGSFAYTCTVHPDMAGTVEVVQTSLIAATSSPAAGEPPRRTVDGGATQAWTVALLGGAGILAGTGALLLGARRFLLAS